MLEPPDREIKIWRSNGERFDESREPDAVVMAPSVAHADPSQELLSRWADAVGEVEVIVSDGETYRRYCYGPYWDRCDEEEVSLDELRAGDSEED